MSSGGAALAAALVAALAAMLAAALAAAQIVMDENRDMLQALV